MTSTRPLDLPPTRRRRALRRLREVPVLPSLVTLGNLFFGFLAVSKVADALRLAQPGAPFAAVVSLFELAAILVFVAMVFDALDGRVARMTNQATPFGAQLDSLADMVTFGMVPAFLGKVLVDWHAQVDGNTLLPMHPKLFYVETTTDEADHQEFRGLPSPAAAAVVCSLIALFCTKENPDSLGRTWLPPGFYAGIVQAMPWVLVGLGLLMVSRVPYPHAMHSILRKRHSMPFLAGLVLFLIVGALEWQMALAAVTVGYVAIGTVVGGLRYLVRRGRDDDDDEDGDELPVRIEPSRN
jgi:CDP-diacylglycerol--serine O-phosphatidyltransferase